MNILILGSKGFIGQNLYLAFSGQSSFSVWAADIVPDYTDPNYLLVHAQQPDFDSLFRQRSFDVCINCSGAAHVPDSFVHTVRDFSLNVCNVLSILEAIRQYSPACRFVNLSSAAVHGNPLHLPVHESSVGVPLSPYGYHKLYAEQLCAQYHHLFGLNIVSIRLFSAYGPGLRKQLFWDLYLKMKGSSHIELWGSGQESRDFIFISDIVSAVSILVNKGEFSAGVYNVSSGTATTIRDAASCFAGLVKWPGVIDFVGQERIGDPLFWQADISKIKALGWAPKVLLEDGLQKYIEWAKGELE